MRVDGNVGDRAGADLSGGRLELGGNAGHSTGEGMSGGLVVVRGNTGDRAGAAAPGRKRGMTGGELVILGNAGDETGALMRRGLVAVGGTTGRCTLLSTIAGTVVACGAAGADAALWNKRGSLICLGSVEPSATYRYACMIQPVYLRLLFRRLRDVLRAPGDGGTHRRPVPPVQWRFLGNRQGRDSRMESSMKPLGMSELATDIADGMAEHAELLRV